MNPIESPALEDIPAPWTCKCETYWLFLWLNNPLPPGIYSPLDAPEPNSISDDFKGSLGMIQVVRYFDTPVGPYDELLIIPGQYGVPGGLHKGKSRLRISRIYVSQKQTCYSGRKLWNIPKHLARFEFSSPPVTASGANPQTLKLAVYPYNSTDETPPFFSATLTPSRYLPFIPFSTRYLPLSTYLVQPPCGQGKEPELVGRKTWSGYQILAYSPKVRLMWVKVDDATEEDQKEGTFWPAVKPWSFGMWLEDAMLEVPAPEEFAV